MEHRTDILIIGAGQAGLALGHRLAEAEVDFVLVDAHARVGDTWRRRWDSLTLFTPRRYDALPGAPLSGDPDGHPGKDEVADYLESYAARFELPVHLDRTVTALQACQSGGFTIDTTAGSYRAERVVVATGPFTTPALPEAAVRLAGEVTSLHSSAYRNPSQIPAGRVLVVGAGNTGVQIADELSRAGRRVTLSVSELGPALPQRVLGRDLFWWFERLGTMRLAPDGAVGRRVRARNPIIGTDLGDLLRRVRRVGRVSAADGDTITFADGARASFDSVIWATGFRPHYPWLRVPVLDDFGAPISREGTTAVPGLSFLGLPWLRNRGSALLGWVGEDAEILADRLLDPRGEPVVAAS